MQVKTNAPVNRHNTSDMFNSHIYLLRNAIYYFLQSVYIVDDNSFYRLVVINHGRLLLDKPYKTLAGAKIAFSMRFGWKLWAKDMHPLWSGSDNP
jgi:hypothetical protein